MKKIITFIDSDRDLINLIVDYQRAHGLSSFDSAVRKLCRDALELKE